MKGACLFFLVSLMVVTIGDAQHAKSMFTASVDGSERISVVKSSIDIPASHESSFWPIYEEYLAKVETSSLGAFRAGYELANSKGVANEGAMENAVQLLALRLEELEIRKNYYREIASAMNGIVAFQFLQTEALLDIMESAQLYDETGWKQFRFYPRALPANRVKEAKYNTIAAAISLEKEQAQNFYQLYARYEEESDALLGEEYDIFMLYAGEPMDYTPALAKRLGFDMISLLEREIKLKQKYHAKMVEVVGAETAARFLAWEDYHSAIYKMFAMAEE